MRDGKTHVSPSQNRQMRDYAIENGFFFWVVGFWRMQVKEENVITEELSEWQDSACEMVNGSADLEEKIARLAVIMRKADDLRLRTVRRVVDLLTPQQAVEFLIAAAELQFVVHGWGVNHDSRRGNV